MNRTDPSPTDVALDPADQSGYRHWRRTDLRFGDLDLNGHINNVAFALFCQEGRIRMFGDAGLSDGTNNRSWRIVNLLLEFHQEMHFPGAVEIGTRVARIGRSSVHLEQGLFNEGRCVATARIVMVQVSNSDGRPAEVDEMTRHRLLAVAGPGSSTPASPGAAG